MEAVLQNEKHRSVARRDLLLHDTCERGDGVSRCARMRTASLAGFAAGVVNGAELHVGRRDGSSLRLRCGHGSVQC